MERNNKIKLHIILSIFTGLIVLCIITILGNLSLNLFKTITMESFANSRQDTLLQISESVTAYCEKIELLSSSYSDIKFIKDQAALPESEIDTENFRNKIDNIKTEIDDSFFFPEIEYELQIICNNGLTYSSNSNHLVTLQDLPKKIWFYKALKENVDSLWQSNILFKENDNKINVISLVKIIKDAEGKPYGAILINLNERQIHQIYSQIIGFQSTIYLVDNNGQIASHPNLSMVGRFFYDMEIFNSFFEENDWAQITKSGKEFLFSKYSSTENPWIVVEEIPMTVITDPFDNISRKILFLAILLLILSVIISMLFSKKISLPFEKLAKTMETAEDGDLNIKFIKSGCYESYSMAASSQKFVNRIQSLVEEVKVIQQEKQNSELQFLQMQINPHFIYNTLFTIRCTVDMGENEKARDMLERFSNMLRKVFRINSPMISIIDNIDYLEDYSAILSQRYGSLSISYELEKGIENEKILKFILQPLVENSVYHGFSEGFTEDSFIKITFNKVGNDFIELHVIDNGCGINKDDINKILNTAEQKHITKIGLSNVRTKLLLYYYGKAEFNIFSEPGEGTDIQIIVPRIVD